MATITEGNDTTVSLTVDDIITIVAPDGAWVSIEYPAGTPYAEFSGARSFGPAAADMDVKVTAISRDCSYEVAALHDPHAAYWRSSRGRYLLRPDGSTLDTFSPTLKPAASTDPVDNGDLVIEATDNSTLTFKLKGSDGTVRSGTVSLT